MNTSKNQDSKALRGRSIVAAIAALIATGSVLPAGAASSPVYTVDKHIQVSEGFQCGTFDGSGSTESGALREFHDQVTFPRWATKATVILQGFYADYSSGDNHVRLIDTFIDQIDYKRKTLTWRAGVSMEDDSGNDPVYLCYYFTAIGWNKARLRADLVNPKRIEDLRDFDGDGVADDDRRNTIFFEVPDRRKPIAMLPQGLSLAYQNEDHHVLQYSYSFIQDGWVSNHDRRRRMRVDGILNDNTHRTPHFNAQIAVLQGKGVKVISDYFDPREINDCEWGEGCIHSGRDVHNVETKIHYVNNVQGDFVIPILSGVDMWYDRDDEHVDIAAAYLRRIQFDPETRNLSYRVTTALLDKNKSPGSVRDYNVALLILNKRNSDFD